MKKSGEEKDIFSVSEYLDKVNTALAGEEAKISGEICNLQMYEGRSYLYFSIKDEKDGSTVKCFMWKRDYRLAGMEIRDGLAVIVTAYPAIYKPNGGLSLQVEMIEHVGEGALQIAYEKLKKKLESEGLFAEERKRPLPEYPRRIGVITSKSGAVINDFLSNIGKWGFEILFVDSKVEGADAAKDLLAALATLSREHLDALVIMRGGGSLESFQAFNNEILVRAVASFPVPVLTGIGHDKDIPLLSYISDKNVSTPTAVANLLNSSWAGARSIVDLSEEKITKTFEVRLNNSMFMVENASLSIERRFSRLLEIFSKAEAAVAQATIRIENRLAELRREIDTHGRDMAGGLERIIGNLRQIISREEQAIRLGDPRHLLRRGYSIVRTKEKIIRSLADVAIGDEVRIAVADGALTGTIKEKIEKSSAPKH